MKILLEDVEDELTEKKLKVDEKIYSMIR